MNQDQITVVRGYLMSKVYKNREVSKERQLFERIIALREKPVCNSELSQYIYASPPTDRYRQLISRLHKKIMEAICSEEHLEKPHLFSYRDMLYIRLKKQIVQCRVLSRTINKYKINLLLPILDEIIEIATKEEIFDILIEALKLKREAAGATLDQQALAELEKQILIYSQCQAASEKAHSLLFLISGYHKARIQTEFYVNPIDLEAAIAEINETFKITNAFSLKCFLTLLNIHKAEREGVYDKALAYCKELLRIFESNHVSFSETMKPDVFLLLARFHLLTRAYEDACEFARRAIGLSKPYSPNHMAGLEYEFLAMFYQDRFDQALALLDHIKLYLPAGEKFISSKYAFYRSCIYFRLGKHSESFQELHNASELSKDRGGWAIGYRYLLIMLQAEFGKFDPTSSSVDSLRKYWRRNDDKLSPRDRVIISTLRKLKRKNFAPPVDSRIEALVTRLSSNNAPDAWRPLTYELIPVHEWIRERENKKRKKTYSLAS